LDGLLELPTDPPRRRGRKAKWDWPTICGEIARRCHNKSGHLEVPENERELARDMLEWCREEYDAEPAESEIRDAVRAVCARLRCRLISGQFRPLPATRKFESSHVARLFIGVRPSSR
jgi:hypothetical protein